MGKTTLLFVVCLVIGFSNAQTPQNIIFQNPRTQNPLAVTLVRPAPYGITLIPLGVNNTNQQWIIGQDGTIQSVSQPGNGLALANANPVRGEAVQVLPLANPPTSFQQWIVKADGSIQPTLATGLYINPVVNDATGGQLVLNANPIPGKYIPWPPAPELTCKSVTDPHITSFYPSSFPGLNNVGIQTPGDFYLANCGGTSVIEGHGLCNGPYYCNVRTAVTNSGIAVVVVGDTVYVNGAVVTIGASGTAYGALVVYRSGPGSYTIDFPGGSVAITLNNITPVSQNLVVSAANPGSCTGLCGTANGTNGCGSYPDSPTPPPGTLDGLDQFTQSWQVPFTADPFNFLYGSQTGYEAANPCVQHFDDPRPVIIDPPPIAVQYCSPMQVTPVAQRCAALDVDAPETYSACLFDVIETQTPTAAAGSIDGFYSRCIRAVPLNPPIVIPTAVTNSVAFGAGLAATVPVGKEISFQVKARDVVNNDIFTGEEDFAAAAENLEIQRTDLKNGFYQFTYTPTEAGVYTISVTGNGGYNHVLGSPFTVQAK